MTDMITVSTTDDGLLIQIHTDGETAGILRRALIMMLRVIYSRYEVNKKIFMPEEDTEK